MINNNRKNTQNDANRSFKQIAKNLSGSDYIRNKRSKEIYRTYRGSSDKVNENVTLKYKSNTEIKYVNGTKEQEIVEFKGLASVASYDMLRSLIHGKDITYTLSGGAGTSAISLQNLVSSKDTWKGSLLESNNGQVKLIKEEGDEGFNVSLFQQSIYGTNGTVGCITENTSSMNFSCCHTPGTSTNEKRTVPVPTFKKPLEDPMYVPPGTSHENSVPLSEAFDNAASYKYIVNIDDGISVKTVSSAEGNKAEVTISPQVAIGSVYNVTVIPFNRCGETGNDSSQTFKVIATPPPPTPTGTAIDPISTPNGVPGYSSEPLTAYFNNANYGFIFETHTQNLNSTYKPGVSTIDGEKYISVAYDESPFSVNISITIYPKNVDGDMVTSGITFTVETYS